MSKEDKGGVKLERNVGLISCIGLTMGTMIGSGIFASPSGVLMHCGSVGMSLLIWFVCGLIALLGAVSYVELSTAIPLSGGEHQYLLRAYGKAVSFLFTWTAVIVLRPCTVAAIALTFANYATKALTGCDDSFLAKIIALWVILSIAFVNVMSVDWATKLQNFFTIAKLLAIVLIICLGMYKICMGYTDILATGFEDSNYSPFKLGFSFYMGLWAYDSWNTIVYITEEVKEPNKTLPRALMIGIPLVTILYVLTNISYFSIISKSELLDTSSVAILMASRTMPTWLAWIIPLSVCFSTFGATNGCMFGASRLAYSSAREGHLPPVLSYCNINRLTPSTSIIFLACLSCLYVLPTDFAGLVDYFSFAAWLFYGLTVSAVIKMRFTDKNLDRPFKVFLPIPILFCCIAFYLVVAPVIDKPSVEFLFAGLFMLSGLLYYFPFVKYNVAVPKCFQPIIKILQLVLNVAPSEYNVDEGVELKEA